MAQPINVATWNLRLATPDDGPDVWAHRKDMVKALIRADSRVSNPNAKKAGNSTSPKRASTRLVVEPTPSGSGNWVCMDSKFSSFPRPWNQTMESPVMSRISSRARSALRGRKSRKRSFFIVMDVWR